VRVDPVTRTVEVAAVCVTGDHATYAFGLAAAFKNEREPADVC
jgi:hypothetical protein